MRVQSLAICVAIVLAAISPLASAYLGERDGFAVYITYPQDTYDIGSQVNVTVHVFYRGEYHDADEVTLYVDWPGDRRLTLTNESTGVYSSAFVIEGDDVWDYNGEVTLEAQAALIDEVGLLEASDSVDLFIDGTQIISRLYHADPRDYIASPGDELEYVLIVRNEYGPIDIDEGFPEVTVEEEGTYDEETLETTRLDVGTYAFSVIVEENITGSTIYRVEVRNEITIGPITIIDSGYFNVEVDVLGVWTRIVNSTDESTEMEFIAVDDRGRAIPEAVFDLEWDYRNSSNTWLNFEGTWTADHQGRARVIMDTPELDYYYVGVEGTVTGDGLVQEIDRGFPGKRTNYTYQPTGLDVENDVEGLITLGGSHTITHNVTYDGEPLTEEEIYVYYIDEHNIYHHGKETTDSQGQFNVTIDTPADLKPNDPRWSEWFEADIQWRDNRTSTGFPFYYPPNWNMEFEDFADENLTLEVSDLHPGRAASVTMDHREIDGEDEDCLILWRIVSGENWTSWINTESGYSKAGCEWTGNRYEASIRLPSFVTEDMEVEVVGLLLFIEGTEDRLVGNNLGGLFPTLIPPEPPGAPNHLAAVQNIDVVTLSWQGPTDDGGSFISSHVVYRGTSSDTLEVLSIMDQTRSYVDSTIEMGTTYFYTVAAVNNAGEGATCEPLMIETIEYLPPTAPLNLTDSFDRIQVYLEWDPPEDDGGQPVTLYKVLRGDGPDDLEEIATSQMLMYFDTSVEVGEHYYYAIEAVNVIGTGEPCEARRVRADFITKPKPPEEVSATYIDGIVVINWSVPSDDGGIPVTGYVLMRGSSPLELEHLADVGLEMTFNDTDLKPGVMYHYTVSAVNSMGNGKPSERFTVYVPEIDPPSTPDGVTLEFVHDRIKVTWLPSEDDGGSPVTGYRILRGVGEEVLEELTVVTIGTTYYDLQVERGRMYRYSIVAINAEKESEPSGETALRIPEVASEEGWTLEWYVWATMVGAAVGILVVVFIVLRRQYQGPT